MLVSQVKERDNEVAIVGSRLAAKLASYSIPGELGRITPVQGALLREVIDVAVIFNALRAPEM